jgi:hypothetical protein
LFRYRNQVLPLDSCLALTRGNPLGLLSSASFLNPMEGVFTAICSIQRGQPPLIGQIRASMGSRRAHLTFLLPQNALNTLALPGLLDYLTAQAGRWGAFHVQAEVDEHSSAFEGMRRASFSTYTFQRIWKLPAGGAGASWAVASNNDTMAVRSLYQSLVPSLVQPMEGIAEKHPQGLVMRVNNELVAYADVLYGPSGIWVQPFVLPSVEKPGELLSSLAASIPHPGGRTIYLCVRSYQAWLELALGEMNADSGPRQALMVRHIAMTQRAAQTVAIPNLEGTRAETSIPLAHLKGE